MLSKHLDIKAALNYNRELISGGLYRARPVNLPGKLKPYNLSKAGFAKVCQTIKDLAPEKKAEYEAYMREALDLAALCAASEDVPVGAVVVSEGVVAGRGYNIREKTNSPLWHAEMAAVEEASKNLGRWNLTGATLVVTKEPCAMCAGLIVQSRISTVVFAVSDAKGGGCGGALQIAASEKLNHRAVLISGILEAECLSLLQTFFKKRRIKS